MGHPDRANVQIPVLATAVLSLTLAIPWIEVARPSVGVLLDPGRQLWQRQGVVLTPVGVGTGRLRGAMW